MSFTTWNGNGEKYQFEHRKKKKLESDCEVEICKIKILDNFWRNSQTWLSANLSLHLFLYHFFFPPVVFLFSSHKVLSVKKCESRVEWKKKIRAYRSCGAYSEKCVPFHTYLYLYLYLYIYKRIPAAGSDLSSTSFSFLSSFIHSNCRIQHNTHAGILPLTKMFFSQNVKRATWATHPDIGWGRK